MEVGVWGWGGGGVGMWDGQDYIMLYTIHA